MFHSVLFFLIYTTSVFYCILATETPHRVVLYGRQDSSETTATVSSAAPSSTPNEVEKDFNVTINGPIFPPSVYIEGESSNDTHSMSVDCKMCSILGHFSVSAGDKDVPGIAFETPADVSHLGNDTGFDFHHTWIAATVEMLNASFEFDVEIKAADSQNELIVPIYSKTISKTIGILTLSATLALELHGWMNSTSDLNFTYGFNFGVPPFSEIILDLDNVTESQSIGFNETTLTPIPLNISRSDVDIDMELSLRPSIDVAASLDILVASGAIGVELGLDVPKIDVSINQVHNVNSKCEPAVAAGKGAPPVVDNGTVAVPEDQIYENLTLVSPSIGFGFVEIFHENVTIVGVHKDWQQNFNQTAFTEALPTGCFYFDSAKKTLSPSPPPVVEPKSGSAPPVLSHPSLGKTFVPIVIVAVSMTML